MTQEKIYIEMIDGTSAFIEVNAEYISERKYQIQRNSEYDNSDNYFEFFPNDIVEVRNHIFFDGTCGKLAHKLVKTGNWNNRKLSEFIYKATCGKLKVTKLTAEKYAEEIKMINSEFNSKFFYPKLIEIVTELEKQSGKASSQQRI
jgi:hypothetical protein